MWGVQWWTRDSMVPTPTESMACQSHSRVQTSMPALSRTPTPRTHTCGHSHSRTQLSCLDPRRLARSGPRGPRAVRAEAQGAPPGAAGWSLRGPEHVLPSLGLRLPAAGTARSLSSEPRAGLAGAGKSWLPDAEVAQAGSRRRRFKPRPRLAVTPTSPSRGNAIIIPLHR